METHAKKANYHPFISVSKCAKLSWKVDDDGSSIWSGPVVTLYLVKGLIYILCDDSTGCKKAGDIDDFPQK